ncbi:MAG: NADH-quinone oxidoreductase subunit C [Flavobacteriia bacterium]|nr:NADH-quinone oxidoreductase subunit C [Flavobacteriia bacterium]
MSNPITSELLLQRLQERFGEAILQHESPYNLLTVGVTPSAAHDIIKWLKEDSELALSFLTLLGAVHYPEQTGREMAVVYHLHSLVHNVRLRLKAFLPIEDPSIATITDLYVGANWQERETFDFYGVKFVGHPNLVRILNEDSMDYHPMRKEYQLEDATREDKDDRFFGR